MLLIDHLCYTSSFSFLLFRLLISCVYTANTKDIWRRFQSTEKRDMLDAIRVYARRYRVIRVNSQRPALYCL